jgi:replicative DNA helicase
MSAYTIPEPIRARVWPGNISTLRQDPASNVPRDEDSEKVVLSSCMNHGERAYLEAKPILDRDCFFTLQNQLVWDAIEELDLNGFPIDMVHVSGVIKDRKQDADVTLEYLDQLHRYDTTPHPERPAKRLRDCAARRRAWIAGKELMRQATRPDADPHDLAEMARAAAAGCDLVSLHKRKLRFMSAEEFYAKEYTREWLFRGLLLRRAPTIMGGSKKSLKTTLMVDAAISLATQTPFLSDFGVAQPMPVGLVSGESGEATIQETAFRVLEARGLPRETPGLHYCFDLPQLTNSRDLAELGAWARELRLGVGIIDPLYLCLLAGARNVEASNLYQMGPVLSRASRALLDAGCTPIFVHHFKQGRDRREQFGPPSLDDLSYAGVQEFARQWLLVSRREEYTPGTGKHRLWMAAGGSGGHTGLWAVDADDGVLQDDFSGRKWDVAVKPAAEAIQAQKEAKEAEREFKKAKQDKADDASLLTALDACDPRREGRDKKTVMDGSVLSTRKFDNAVARLVADRIIKIVQVQKLTGNGAKTKCKGLRRVVPDDME